MAKIIFQSIPADVSDIYKWGAQNAFTPGFLFYLNGYAYERALIVRKKVLTPRPRNDRGVPSILEAGGLLSTSAKFRKTVTSPFSYIIDFRFRRWALSYSGYLWGLEPEVSSIEYPLLGQLGKRHFRLNPYEHQFADFQMYALQTSAYLFQFQRPPWQTPPYLFITSGPLERIMTIDINTEQMIAQFFYDQTGYPNPGKFSHSACFGSYLYATDNVFNRIHRLTAPTLTYVNSYAYYGKAHIPFGNISAIACDDLYLYVLEQDTHKLIIIPYSNFDNGFFVNLNSDTYAYFQEPTALTVQWNDIYISSSTTRRIIKIDKHTLTPVYFSDIQMKDFLTSFAPGQMDTNRDYLYITDLDNNIIINSFTGQYSYAHDLNLTGAYIGPVLIGYFLIYLNTVSGSLTVFNMSEQSILYTTSSLNYVNATSICTMRQHLFQSDIRKINYISIPT